MAPTKNISYKSTKQDLWTAYSELMEKVANQPIKLPVAEQTVEAPQFMRQIADLKLSLSKELDKIGEEIIGQSEVLQNIKSSLTNDKQQALSDLNVQKSHLEQEIKKVKEIWGQEEKLEQIRQGEEQRLKALERKKEEDEYQYSQSKKRRQQQDEFEAGLALEQKQLDEQFAKLNEHKSEITKMEKELAELPAKMEGAIKSAKEELSKHLVAENQRKIYELTLAHKNEQDIAKLKIDEAEKTIKALSAEIVDLKRQLETAARQLKEIAVSVIDSRKPLGQNEQK